jgi:histidinol dehydrogenase
VIRIISASNRRAIDRLLADDQRADPRFDRRVAAIIDRVRSGGDAALTRFARRFDGLRGPIEVTREEMIDGAARTPPDVRRAINQAVRHIRRVATRQVPKGWRITVDRGVSIEQRVEPLARVGCYVPGGRFPLPSSLLMTAVPARVAGVREVVVCCPRPEPAVMTAALASGVTRLFRIGGAHAVAAMAFGTSLVPRVDKIVGPGNRYVAVAKALVSRTSAIDFFAGPTEIVIVAASGRADWIAADLLAQAEHDPDARSVFITWSRALAGRVAKATALRAAGQEIATRSLSRHGAIVVAKSAAEAMALANRIAPEHLVVDRESLVRQPVTAGAVFVGPYTAQAAGDYATGSNHVLPTSGAARFRGGLSAADFVRVIAVQRLTRQGLEKLAPTIISLAKAEGLRAHAESIAVRLDQEA